MAKHNLTTSTLFAALACAAIAGCGDDLKHNGPSDAHQGSADASTIDGPPGTPDASPDAMPGATVAGTLAVTDVTVLDPAAAAVGGINGGAINFTFSDLTQGGGTVLSGTSTIGGCVVTKFDPAHPPNPQLDIGPITVTNLPDVNSNDGLLKTVGMSGVCTFQAAFGGYVCISDAAQGTGTVVATDLPNNPPSMPAGLIAYTFPTDTKFATDKLVGSYLVVNGFTNTKFNSGASAFPIISQDTGTATVIVVNAAGEGQTSETVAGTASFTVLNGFNPVPAAGAGADFLGKGGVTIATTDNAKWPGMSTNVPHITGQGWSLTDPGDPTALPLTGTAASIVFGCSSDTTKCGSPGALSSTDRDALTAMIVTGTATNKSLTGLAPFQMPTEVPGTDTWLSFTCAQPLGKSVTLTAEALQNIIDFAPTRVEVRVLNAGGAILQDPNNTLNQTNLLAGFGFVGHTDGP